MNARSRDDRQPVRWVPVGQLSRLARALLSDDLGGRDVVPQHVADRVTVLAEQWAAHGFTSATVQPWKDLPPATAAYLTGRGVAPSALDTPVTIAPGGAQITVRQALTTHVWSAEQAGDRFGASGTGTPSSGTPSSGAPSSGTPSSGTPSSGTPSSGTPLMPPSTPDGTPAQQPATAPAPAVFSHPSTELDHANQTPRPKPSRTPFGG